MAAIDERRGSVVAAQARPFSEVSNGYTYFEEGDVLFAKITPCMQNGKHAVAMDLIDGFGFGTTEIYVFRPGPAVLAEWVHAFVRQSSFLREAAKHFTGAVGQQRVPDHFIRDVVLPLPPLAEQKRILARIEQQLAEVDRALAAAETQLEAANLLATLQLDTEFSRLDGHPRRRIGDFATIQSGYAFKSDWFAKTGIRLLRNANVFHGYVGWEDTVWLPESQRSAFASYELSAGDLVLSLDRPVVSGGVKAAILSAVDVPSLLLQRVGRFIWQESMDREYIYFFLNTSRFISSITRHDQSLGVPHIAPRQIQNVEIPFPSIEEQRCISDQLKRQATIVARLRSAVRFEIEHLSKLHSALLGRAFRGNLWNDG